MKMEHVTIRVADMETSIAFYTNVLGLKIQRDMRPRAPIVFLADTPEAVPVELIQETENIYKGSGIDVGFRCDDVQAAYDRLQAEGYELSAMISPRPGVHFFYVKDPNGVSIQLIGE